ncbi:MAG: hypothetical protein RL417_797 [Pseudomonadota bacterium]|jgi:hypothetical protein
MGAGGINCRGDSSKNGVGTVVGEHRAPLRPSGTTGDSNVLEVGIRFGQSA